MTSVVLCLLFITLISQASLSSASSTCNQEDKRVLLQIKKEANNPSFLSSWSPHTDCCDMSWSGVSCGYKTNRVQYITLIGNLADRHAFQIPPSFGNLPRLERLFLFGFPNLTGPIPESISKLTNLMFLTISDTAISGPIPSSLGKLKNLVDLDLSFNKLSGTLPPSLSQLHLLTRMDFDNNKLTGTIPDSYGSLKNVFTLALSHNQLSGRIPDSLGKMNNLYYVGLSQNRLEGDAYMLFGSNKGTVRMFLSRNMLEFDLGRVELPVNMTTLDVSHNRIYGKLPIGVQNLESLNVSYNRLCGEIPKGGNLQSFNVSSYSHNACLCGVPLPSCK
ncbi:polygalacturonase inhibitor 2 [Arachis ipaensis]|uniref:polygalacturonase inhibitor 2 n=1 Tax=Arachis ipaensis TaxID=130454 RepID=UPI0007AFB239|nr:polygalacturonase inhibitor 2 [Arachis ipaensis]